MKRSIAFISIVALIAVAIFGFMAIGHGVHHLGCIAETATGTACPENNIFNAANFLLNAFKGFSMAYLNPLALQVLFLLCACTAILILSNIQKHWTDSPRPSRTEEIQLSLPLKFDLNHWLSLHEKRDPVFSL